MKTVLLSICLFAITLGSAGQKAKKLEDLKALYIFNFTKLFNWECQSNLKIGVIGNSQVLLSLQEISKRTNNSFDVIKISQQKSIEDCNIIYIPSSQSRNLQMIKSTINNSAVLLVSDEVPLLNKGAGIAFNLEGDKLKYYINKTNLDLSDLAYNSKLLHLGEVIDM
ncbi:YfiR family protein [Carboxylicivirga sp. M1479]|uniref:YfiR family protein n=1 Tax=Carboxylicivirga sp. M1479 TaxID=2594476 RepID=UPI00163D86E5|nr:YfiR family protein [Carboxylicivirga sp. M1479]